MSETVVTFVKLGLALLALVAAWRLLRGKSRWASGLLTLCAALSVCAYFQFGRLPAGFVHRWEMFHYYVGSKYHQELGYKRLYGCTLLVDAEDGLRSAQRRTIRDLETDGTISASSVLAAPEACKQHFSAARWQSFRKDVRFFRRGLGPRAWEQAQLDHGYNPPPLWTAVWGKLCEVVPASFGNLRLLAAIDLLLMLGALLSLGVGFGRHVALLALVFWGTQAASGVGWTGGGLARQDWLFLSLAGVALLRRQHFGWAGAALALAGLLRLFPLVLLLGAAGVWLARRAREGRFPAATRRFVTGAVLATSLAIGVSVAHSGARDYREFWSHIQLRHEAIVNNHMGLRTLLASAPVAVVVTHGAARHEPRWVGERRERLHDLRPLHALLVTLALAGIGVALWQTRQAWVGAALGTALIPLLMDPANYYYSFFLVMVPLALRRRALAVLWCALAAGGQLLERGFWFPEQRYAALSGLYLGVTSLVVLAFITWKRPRFSMERSLPCKAIG